MPIVMLIMHREMIVQILMKKLQDSTDICIVHEPNYDNANTAIHNNTAKVALIEAAESGSFDMAYCLTLCKTLRKNVPQCKLLLMCPEQDEESIKQVVDAKGQRQIDDFVFYDVTIDYLVSKLISVL